MTDCPPPEALLAGYPDSMAALAERLRTIVRETVPDAIERVRVGWRVIGYNVPAGRRTPFVAWVMAERVHVHLGFPHGVLLRDPARVLGGAGETKRARWFTFSSPDAIHAYLVAAYLREAVAIAREPSLGHLVRHLDLDTTSPRPGRSGWDDARGPAR